jgi:hypothetical protein
VKNAQLSAASPIRGIGSHKLAQMRPALQAIRGMKTGSEIRSFRTRKAAEQWIAQSDVWAPLKSLFLTPRACYNRFLT